MNNRKVVHSQGRQIIYNVIQYIMNKEKCKGNILYAKVSSATGVSYKTVIRIMKEGAENPQQAKFSTPRKTIKMPSPKTTTSQFEEDVIRRIIHSYATIHKRRPTMKTVYEAMKKDHGFSGSLSSFRIVVHRIGFRWRKSPCNKQILVEKSDIRGKRVMFLRNLIKYKEEGRNIVYTDETYIHSSHTVPKCWDDGSTNGLKTPVSKGQRLIIVHAGGARGFVTRALLIFKSGLKTGDYHDDMNHKNYLKWLNEKLIPNLEKNSVLVIDNASYHNVSILKCPTSSWRKGAMQQWLSERNIIWQIRDTKMDLYNIIKLHKPRNKNYVADKLLAEHGHVVLRLPPYHPELNPIEKIWALVKNRVAARNTTFKMDDVRRLTEEEFNKVTIEDWQNICRHVEATEKEYIEKEYIMDDVDELIIRVNYEDESDSSDYLSSEDEEDDEEFNLECEPIL